MRRLRTFESLRNRNYRLYVAGQTLSANGTWMQRVGQGWLVLELTGSGTLLGVTLALQHLPMLLAGPWGGLFADRLDKRRLLLWTQSISGALALFLGVLTATGLVQFWMVLILAFALGTVNALDHPTRQTFVLEMVGSNQVTNAVTLNSIVNNAAKAVGPAIAGVLISIAGLAASFLINAVSYFAVVVALALMSTGDLRPSAAPRRARGQLREGLRYVARTSELAAPLLLMTLAGMLAFEFQVVLPLFARDTFGGGSEIYGLMFSAMGIGAVLGGLIVAGSLRATNTVLLVSALGFGGLVLIAAIAPTLTLALVALFGIGAASIAFRATANSMLQLRASPEMRGRVMALWGIAMMGTTPIGGPLIGRIAETAGPRFALGLGGVATMIGAIALFVHLLRRRVPDFAGPVPPDISASAIDTAAGADSPIPRTPPVTAALRRSWLGRLGPPRADAARNGRPPDGVASGAGGASKERPDERRR
ncbi:MAG: MFS transporter [Nitriliruptorales bacterium]|nr:MFS transporter [Nitriliruptorales bacterium]